MYIAMLKTTDNQIAVERDTLGQALNTLNNLMEGRENVREALVLEETEYLDDQYPDFSSCKVVASLRVIK
jgi:hypothetical protein